MLYRFSVKPKLLKPFIYAIVPGNDIIDAFVNGVLYKALG